jgi:septal ring factor EnvC (AmiA/AmiB activator)
MKIDTVKQYRAELEQQQQQLAQNINALEGQLVQTRANLHATQGAIQALDKLIKQDADDNAASAPGPESAESTTGKPAEKAA